MRIEDIDKVKLSKARNEELDNLKLRFTQLWDKEMKKSLWSLSVRNGFLKKYRLLLDELGSRKLEHSTNPIDRAAFKKAMALHKFGIDVTDFDDVVVMSDCIVIDANSIDLKKVGALVEKQQSELSEIFEKQDKIEDDYIPLYDLVLRAKQETVKVEIQKPYPNEHSARLQDPKMAHIKVRRTSGSGESTVQGVKIPSTIGIIWYVVTRDGKEVPIPQALRFPIKSWTATKAKKWLSDNDITSKLFEPATKVTKAIWSRKYINDLSDSAFLYIEPDGEKDDEGKTKPRTLRHFPYKDSTDKVDLPHLRNALARIPQSKLPKAVKDKASAKAKKILEDMKEGKKFEKVVSIFPIEKAGDEHVCCSVVYAPGSVDDTDLQGDFATENEIRLAAYKFMEEVQIFKMNHNGKPIKAKILESYIAPQDLEIAGNLITKGSWIITTRILDKKVWEAIKKKEILGMSMAGFATGKEK